MKEGGGGEERSRKILLRRAYLISWRKEVRKYENRAGSIMKRLQLLKECIGSENTRVQKLNAHHFVIFFLPTQPTVPILILFVLTR